MEHSVTTKLVFSWSLAAAQVGLILWFAAAIYATILATRAFRGWVLFAWVCFCWLVPVIGPLVVILCAKREFAKASVV